MHVKLDKMFMLLCSVTATLSGDKKNSLHRLGDLSSVVELVRSTSPSTCLGFGCTVPEVVPFSREGQPWVSHSFSSRWSMLRPPLPCPTVPFPFPALPSPRALPRPALATLGRRLDAALLLQHGSLHHERQVLEEPRPGLVHLVAPAVLQRRFNGLDELGADELEADSQSVRQTDSQSVRQLDRQTR